MPQALVSSSPSVTSKTTIPGIHGEYFPHIDGIRALAILPVVLYHLCGWLCPGGFAGVDVFFVISGYLITGGILRDLQKDRFTIRNFYHRRIRRILPANFALLAGVFLAGCFFYYSVPLKALGGAVSHATFFVTNLYFWRLGRIGGGYFAPIAEQEPLLHLWSLSIEEQFYLFIPLLCAILWHWRRRWLAPMLVMLAAASFVASLVAITTKDINSAFYLLPYRAWELLAGSLLSIVTVAPLGLISWRGYTQVSLSSRVPPWFPATAGLLLVLAPYVFLSHSTPFPGVAALPSILGAVMLIRCGQTGWVSRLLCWQPCIALGKISYSLYLWHWPVIVFWRYATYDQLVVWDYVGMLTLSLLLAYLSWRFVEMPVRVSPTWTMQRSFTFAAVGIVLLATLSLTCVFQRGWPGLIHPRADAIAAVDNIWKPPLVFQTFQQIPWLASIIADDELEKLQRHGYGTFRIGEVKAAPDVFLLGDSHAGVLGFGLHTVLQQHNLAGIACSIPSADMTNMSSKDSQEALRELRNHPHISKVILAQRWLLYRNSLQWERLKKFALCIKGMGKTLYILTDVVEGKNSEYEIMSRVAVISPRRIEEGWDGYYSQEYYDQQQGKINQHLQAICNQTGAVFVPLHWMLKQADGRYKTFEIRAGRHVALYFDYEHLSSDGSLKAGQFLAPYLFGAAPSTATDK